MRYEDVCETVAFNSHSPGPVTSDEELLRCGFHPENFSSGKLAANILPIEHLKLKEPAEKSGCSVDRLAYSNREHLRKKLLDLAERNQTIREKEIIIQFACREIRQVSNEDKCQAFKVLDIAFEHDKSHAAIIAAKEYKESYLRKLRNKILDIWRAKPFKTISEIFGVETG